jgi:lipopolysaccharide export system protein LptA
MTMTDRGAMFVSRQRIRMRWCLAAAVGLLLCAGGLALAQGPSTTSSAQANASQGSATGTPNALQGFSQNRGEPIHIDAATLEVRDKDKVATFRGDAKTGDVKVVQGDTVMRSKVLVVFYEEDAPGGAKPKADPKAVPKSAQATLPGPGGGNQQIRRLEAKGNVIVTQADQTVTGDNGVFDNKANTVTMRGNVILTQGQNIAKGDTLVVDLTTGVSHLETGSGRVNAVFFPNQGNGASPPASAAPAPSSGGKPLNLNSVGSEPAR